MSAIIKPTDDTAIVSAFSSSEAFESAQRMARMLCSSSLVPENYRGDENLANAVIALEMAGRIGANPLSVMQSLYVVHGRPAWSAAFLIATFNACGRFKPLRYVLSGTGEDYGCVAWTTQADDDEVIEGPRVTMAMARAEGWSTKKGSKWLTMPELMLRYRAAAFLIRTVAPELSLGIMTAEESKDIGPVIEGEAERVVAAEDLTKMVLEDEAPVVDAPAEEAPAEKTPAELWLDGEEGAQP